MGSYTVMAGIRQRWFSGVMVLLLFLHFGSCQDVQLNFEHPNQGFFLKPFYLPSDDSSPPQFTRTLAVTSPKGPVSLRTQYGPYLAKLAVAPTTLQQLATNASISYQSVSMENRDLSAHLVSHSLVKSKPRIQVLFHSSQNQAKADKNNTSMDSLHNALWCLQVRVGHEREEVTGMCELKDGLGVCLVEKKLPVRWWSEGKPSANVSYTAFSVDQKHHCADAVNSIVPGKSHTHVHFESHIGSVTLLEGTSDLQELREDHNVLIYMPQRSFYPGSKFRVPVRLQAESDLEFIVMRVRTRNGIRVLGAEASNRRLWEVKPNIKPHRQGAFVVAFVSEKDKYSKTNKIQDVFEWVFEVDDGPEPFETGKIVFSLDYELSNSLRENSYNGRNRMVTQVHIRRDDVETIVPVVKSTELVNTAILTGKLQSYSMKIYAIKQTGEVLDVTSQTTCHSGDTTVLKVVVGCNLLYLDGTETKGSSSVSIISKYGHHNRFLFFKVWAPELPLDIELSDNKLNQIKAWKVSRHQLSPRGGDSKEQADSPGARSRQHDEIRTTCNLRYQQALVDVYARFHVKDGSRKAYLVHRKAYMKVTDLVMDKLRVADSTVASLTGRVIQGQLPGLTEVQVLSKTGRVISAKEVRVTKDKVAIERLVVNVVSGVSLNLTGGRDLQGTLMATATVDPVLHKKYQEAFLDVNVKYSDGTLLPLKYVAPNDYYLNGDSLNNHVVGFRIIYPDEPRVIALGQGKGELLKLALELGDENCHRNKKTRPLAVSYIYVNVDFSKSVEEEQDIRKDMPTEKEEPRKDQETEEEGENTEKPENSSKMEKEKGEIKPDANPVLGKQKMTASEGGFLTTGIYVLLGVFSLAAVFIFGICAALVYRYQHKRVPKDKGEPVAEVNDWVWLGPATLERNSITTECSRALMSEEDFNGNQILHAGRSTTPSATASNRSSMHSSNRNSVVSTYRGSECSIRITSNPLQLPTDPRTLPEGASGSDREWDYSEMGMTQDEMITYFDNLKESTA